MTILSIAGIINIPVWIIGLVGLVIFLLMQVLFVLLHKPGKEEIANYEDEVVNYECEGNSHKVNMGKYYKDIFKASWKMMLVSLLFTVGSILFMYFFPFLHISSVSGIVSMKRNIGLMIASVILYISSIFVPMILHYDHNDAVKKGKRKAPYLTIPLFGRNK